MKHQSIELGLVCAENPLDTERESVCWQNYDVGLLCCCCEMFYESQAGLTLKNQIIHNLYVCCECNGNGLRNNIRIYMYIYNFEAQMTFKILLSLFSHRLTFLFSNK